MPFGPSARPAAGERREPGRQETPGPFPDFWSEESAVVQDVIEAPAEPGVVQTPEAVDEPAATDTAAAAIGAEENTVVRTSTQLPADHPTPHATPSQRTKARLERWRTPSLRNRQTRVAAVAILVLCAIAGAVVVASQGPRPAARISTFSSSADAFGRLVPRAVAVAQASLRRAQTSLTLATRPVAAQRRRPAHQQEPAASTPPTAAESAPALTGNGTSQTVGGGSSPPPPQSATSTQSQYSRVAEPAQPAASTNQPAHPSPLGGLACGC